MGRKKINEGIGGVYRGGRACMKEFKRKEVS
jgi:hypothetical protein